MKFLILIIFLVKYQFLIAWTLLLKICHYFRTKRNNVTTLSNGNVCVCGNWAHNSKSSSSSRSSWITTHWLIRPLDKWLNKPSHTNTLKFIRIVFLRVLLCVIILLSLRGKFICYSFTQHMSIKPPLLLPYKCVFMWNKKNLTPNRQIQKLLPSHPKSFVFSICVCFV